MSNSHRNANNLMLLCGGCSSGFDQRPAIWVFLPSDLDALIEDELEFQATRRKCAKQGWVVGRAYDFGAVSTAPRNIQTSGHLRSSANPPIENPLHPLPRPQRLHPRNPVPRNPAEDLVWGPRCRNHPQPERYLRDAAAARRSRRHSYGCHGETHAAAYDVLRCSPSAS